MRIWTIACSSSINLSWFLLILGWRVGILWGCELKFLLDCLCPLMAWRRVVLLCLLVIQQPSWWSKKEPHWYSHGSFIFNDLGVSLCDHGCDLMRHHRQTIDQWCLLARECTPWCGGIPSSWYLLSTCELVSLKMMKAGIFWPIWSGSHHDSPQHSSLRPGKAQC